MALCWLADSPPDAASDSASDASPAAPLVTCVVQTRSRVWGCSTLQVGCTRLIWHAWSHA